MAKAQFSKDFNFTPAAHGGRVSKLYPAGMVHEDCTRECIEQAEKAGVLVDGKGSQKSGKKADGRNTTGSQTGSAKGD